MAKSHKGIKTPEYAARGVAPTVQITRLLHAQGAMSQAEIVRRTGLGKSTVSRAIEELRRAKVVVDAGRSLRPAGGASGRPAAALTLNPENGTCIGIQIGPTFIRAVLADIAHTVLATRTAPLDWDFTPEQGIEAAKRLIDRVQKDAHSSPKRLLAIGVAVPSPVHPRTGKVIRSSIIGAWSGAAIAEMFEARLGRTVVVDNEANCGALAEFTWGAARGYRDVLYYKIDLGLGGALIAGGHLVRGIAGGAGEFGHITYDPAGPVCRCGNRGCIELYAATPALLSILRPTYGADFSAAQMIAAAQSGDAGCRRVIADGADIAGRGLAILCNALNPELIVIGGEMGQAGALLLEPLRRGLAHHVLIPFDSETAAPMTEIVIGSLGADASALGAMGLALRQIAGGG